MSKFNETRISQENGAVVKRVADQESYIAELNALKGLSGRGITPEILAHDNTTKTLRIEDAGITLHSLRADLDHFFSVSQIRRLASGLFECLHKLHAADFCHYDVKEDNICIQAHTRDDGSLDLDKDFKVKLIDFGLSFKVDEIPESYFNNKKLGTPVCRSPEHIAGQPQYGQAADVFCAAATIVQIIDGLPEAFPLMSGSPDRQILAAQERADVKRTLTTLSGEVVPKDLQILLFGMLHPDPNERPKSKACYHMLGLAV
jgi:serine/threonine protein kinase